MQNESKKQQVQNFVALTGTSKQIAEDFLTKSRWNLQEAINRFYDQGAPMPQQQKIVSLSEVQKFFDQNSVAENQKTKILNQEGLEKLFSQYLNIDMSNPVIGHLMINAMKMEKAGIANKQNIYNLFTHTQTKSFKELAKKMPVLEKQLKDQKDLFKSMYLGFFQFYSTTKTPTLDFDIAIQIWSIYLQNRMLYHKQFIEYLNQIEKKPFKIYKDVWKMVFQFSKEFKSIESYQESEGWPLLLDDFVNYLKKIEKK